LIGISLYVAEGAKGDKSVDFANSDPKLIVFMMGWFREFCKVSEEKFRGAIWIHDNLDKHKTKKYWSKITKIPPRQFNKAYVVKDKTNSKKIRKNKHKCGVFSIRIYSVKLQRKILGWVSGILRSQLV
jgi:hypothetical protein